MTRTNPFKKHFWLLAGLTALLVFALAACQSAAPTEALPRVVPTEAPAEPTEAPAELAGMDPMVEVSDQSIESGSVMIAKVVSNGPGWLVIHAQVDGKPGPILGYSPVADGENTDVTVEIDATMATETLYAMLHTDAGEVGAWEFPDGPDTPVQMDGKVVTPPFQVTAGMAGMTPMVEVSDQSIETSSVTIAKVVSNGPGWLVIHAQADGKPGPILGYSPLADGENMDVTVEIDATMATETLYAMLHTDAGEVGAWEFPDGPDVPVMVDEKVVTPPFKVTALTAVSGDPENNVDGEPIVLLGESDELGPFLTAPDGMTLYYFTKDEPGITNCYEVCAERWPPLYLEEGQALVAGEGVAGELGTVARDDGGVQVTYNGYPLYYWINDAAPGETSGHGVGGVWAVVSPDMTFFQIVPEESKVSYEVGEVFLENNRFGIAVGTTNQIEGLVLLDLNNPRSALVAPITVDISTLKSDSGRRDNKIRSDFLESATYPIATFTAKQIEGLPETYNEGDEITLTITGDLTVKETTQPVTFQTTVQIVDGALIGHAETTILMSDFGVGPIDILGVLRTEDEVLLAFDFVARP